MKLNELRGMTQEALETLLQEPTTKGNLKGLIKKALREKAEAQEAQEATIITAEAQEKTEVKAEALRLKFQYGTAGTQWEIGPNLADMKHNEDKQEVLNLYNNIPTKFNQTAVDGYKENGELKITRVQTTGNLAGQYIISLTANKDIQIPILTKVTYYPDKKTAEAKGYSNLYYKYEKMETITILKGHTILLGATTNPGKAVGYSQKWAFLYKVGFDKPTYSKPNTQTLYKETAEGKLEIIGKNSGNTQGSTTWEELLQSTILDHTQYLGRVDMI